MTTDNVGSLVPSVHQINHLELLTMSVDLDAELNAFKAMIVTLKDDIIRQRDAVSISSINTFFGNYSCQFFERYSLFESPLRTH